MPKLRRSHLTFLALLIIGFGVIVLPSLTKGEGDTGEIETGTAALSEIERMLKLIEVAKEQWAYENNKVLTDGVTLDDLTGYLPMGFTSAPEISVVILTTIGEPAMVDPARPLNGKAGPFTITSF